MPANNLIRPNAEHIGETTRQSTCTCPSSPGGLLHSNEIETMTMELDAHSPTCALHPSLMAVRKQQAKQRQLGLLQRHQQQQQHRKLDPFGAVRVHPSKTFHLYTGSRFQGKQRSGSHSYDVVVDIKVPVTSNVWQMGSRSVSCLTLSHCYRCSSVANNNISMSIWTTLSCADISI